MRPPDLKILGYLHRWHLLPWGKRWPNAYLHHILAPDTGNDLHDHPAWNVSIVLWGWYREEFISGRSRLMFPGRITWRLATVAHRISEVSAGGCWTVWVRGGHRRKWGFWVGSRWNSNFQWVPWDEHDNLERRA